MIKYLLAAAISIVMATPSVYAQPASQTSSIEITDIWARATAGGSRTGAAYAVLSNRGSAGDRLVSASSPAAGKVELHTMSMDGGIMRMRQVQNIEIAPGASVELKPGGLHIMLMDLKAPLKEGEKFPLSLTFEKGGRTSVEVTVRPIGATGNAPAPRNMQHMHK